jgi:HJR/Mrr/RecB family endonuclease
VRITLGAFFFCLSALAAGAMELGQSRDSITVQHGPATEENHSKNTAVYRAGPWKVDLEYRDDTACKLTFTRIGQLSEEEIQSILNQNAGGAEWRELEGIGPKRNWQRTDFATAECDRLKPRSIIFAQAAPGHETSSSTALVEAEPAPTAELQNSPLAYASESRAAARAQPAPTSTPPGLASRFGIFVDGHPLVFIIPSLLLAIVWLLQRAKKNPAPIPIAPRRVVTPRAANDAMATEPADSTLDGLEPEAFELLMGEIFRRQGYAVEMSGGVGGDGGTDLTLRKEEQQVLVQCRHWSSWKVSAPSIEEFYGAIMAAGAIHGIFVTSGGYTCEARALAEGKPIQLIDRVELERLIAQVSLPDENLCEVDRWIDRFASSVAVVDPACPFCGSSMKLKRGVQGRPFWSCLTSPRCGGKRDGRVELLRARPLSSEM